MRWTSRAWRRRPAPFGGCSHSSGDVKTSQDIQAFLASAGGQEKPPVFGWPLGEGGSSPGDTCWGHVLGVSCVGPCGAQIWGEDKVTPT